MRDHLLAFDQGTTSSRALLIGPDGETVAVAQAEFRQIFPKPGWVEHDPDEIWATQSGVAAEAVNRAGVRLDRIAAIGITNQRETIVFWSRRTGRALVPAIVWQDRRTAELCAALKDHEPLVQDRTGLLLDPYFSASKIAWALRHWPDVAGRERGAGERGADGRDDRVPDVLRVVLDPAGAREDLAELLLADAGDAETLVEDDGAARRRALVDREDVSGHQFPRTMT